MRTRRYHEVVEQRLGPGEYIIRLDDVPETSLGGFRSLLPNSGLGKYRKHLTLGHYPDATLRGVRPRRGLGITSQEGGALSTAASVGASTAIKDLAPEIGAFAGPIGAGVGVLVSVIVGLFQASAARAKGAKEENQAVNVYLPTWDQGLQAIFAAANNGTATPSECISALQTLMQSWWQAAAQFKGLPGVADASNGGSNCGSYTSGSSTPCTPTGGPGCDKSCTAMCCIGCHDLMPSAADAARIFSSATGGSVNVCTVYGSSYGASQRSGYTLTYTPPAAGTVAGTTESLVSAVTGGTGTILGLPWYLVLGAAALVAYEVL